MKKRKKTTIPLVRMAQSRLLRPQNILLATLFLLFFGALLSAGDAEYAVQSLLVFASLNLGYFVPYLLQRVRKLPSRMRWENAGITLLILHLLVDQRIGLLWAIALGLITALIKMNFRFQGKPVLNPASAGLAVVAFVGIVDTWWGVSFEPRFTDYFISIAAFFTLPIAGYVAHKYNKLPISAALLLAFAVMSFLLSGTVPWVILLEGTLFFFALVMATEPLTAPVKKQEQIVFGTVIGILLAFFLSQAWMLTYIGPLLIANLGYAAYRWWSQRQLLARAAAARAQLPKK